MTKALFLPVLALVCLLNFSGGSSLHTKAAAVQPLCGPSLSFYNNTSYTITKVKLQNSSVGVVEFNNPSFPFTYNPGYGGFYYIWVTTSSGGQSGTVEAYYSVDQTYINCRVFISPQTWALSFSTACNPYDIKITENTDCP